MSEFPAYCSKCDLNFTTGSMINIPGVVSMVGSKVNCPRCGQMAPISDGVYDFRQRVQSFIADSKFSSDELKILKNLLENAKIGNYSAVQVGREIDQQIPKASGLKSFFTEGWNLPFVIQVVLAVIMWCYPFSSDAPHASTNKNTATSERPTDVPTSTRAKRRDRGRTKQTVKSTKIIISGKHSKDRKPRR